jgi:hypothetical protein
MVYHFVIWNMTFCFEKGYTIVIPRLYHFKMVHITTLNMNFALCHIPKAC